MIDPLLEKIKQSIEEMMEQDKEMMLKLLNPIGIYDVNQDEVFIQMHMQLKRFADEPSKIDFSVKKEGNEFISMPNNLYTYLLLNYVAIKSIGNQTIKYDDVKDKKEYFVENIGTFLLREIEFRGMTKEEKSRMVYGSLVINDHERYFIFDDNDMCEIIPETFGQYTERKDKNGKKIYEDDIIKYDHWYNEFGAIKFGEFDISSEGDDECPGCSHTLIGWYAEQFPSSRGNYCEQIELVHGDWFTVLGNPHENPELFQRAINQ